MSFLKCRKGTTLYELVATMAIVAILAPAVLMTIFSTMKMYAWAKDYADLCGVVSVIDSTIERELSLSSGTSLDSSSVVRYRKNDTQPKTMKTGTTQYGGQEMSILYINGSAVFDPSFYKNVSVRVSFEMDNNLLYVTVTYSGTVSHQSQLTISRI